MSQRSRVARVATGILLSRISGLVRMRVIAHFLGLSPVADVWVTAMRGPNVVQNLLGEQSLSAAFIPIYARRLAQGDEEEARRFAGAIFSLLVVVLTAVGLLGVWLAEPIVSLVSPGLLLDAEAVRAGAREIDRFPLAVSAVRVLFPMTCILVLSAWCLGILNSHGRFFLPYVAGVAWNAAIVGVVLWVGVAAGTEPGGDDRILIAATAGALLGAVLQLLVQLPTALRLLGGLRPNLSLEVSGVRESLRLVVPALAGRGAAQLSGYVDLAIASLLAVGSLAAIGWAQALYLLPVALFGLSMAAVELPTLSKELARPGEAVPVSRIEDGLSRVSFLTVPAVVLYFVFGHLLVGTLYRSGRFGIAENWLVYLVLAAYSLGLAATTMSRYLQSVFFALRDPKAPARVAFLRVAVAAVVGGSLALLLDETLLGNWVPQATGSVLSLGAVGLALGSAVSSWVELTALLRLLRSRGVPLRFPRRSLLRDAASATVAAGLPALLWWTIAGVTPLLAGPVVAALFGAIYVVAAHRAGNPEAKALVDLGRRLGRGEPEA